jgi:spermidine/putrescine transport system permease protein
VTAHRASTGLRVHVALAYAFLYLPIAVLVIFSFSTSRYASVWSGFTLDWYGRLLQNQRIIDALLNSLIVASSATMIAAVFGTAAALGLMRLRGRQGALETLVSLPIVMPELVQGIALLLLFTLLLPLRLGLLTITLAHAVFGIAYVTLVVRARLEGLDPQLEEAARDLGASARQAFWRITLPLIMPGVVGGALLAFTLSFDDFVIAFFVTGPGASTLPIEIYSMVKRGVTPEINALATLILLASVTLIAAALWLQQRGSNETGAGETK